MLGLCLWVKFGINMFGKKKVFDFLVEWIKIGSFVYKLSRGWLYIDNLLMEGGVCYVVKVSLYY